MNADLTDADAQFDRTCQKLAEERYPLSRWNDERASRGEPELAIGIGLNYATAVIGDVGGGQTLSFT